MSAATLQMDSAPAPREPATSQSRHPHQFLFSIPEAAPLLGRSPNTLRREIERKSRPDDANPDHVVAVLAGGVRAFKLGKGAAGRWPFPFICGASRLSGIGPFLALFPFLRFLNKRELRDRANCGILPFVSSVIWLSRKQFFYESQE